MFQVFQRQLQEHLRLPLTGRPSVQRIRCENVGKVSACVRKFDSGFRAAAAAPPPPPADGSPVLAVERRASLSHRPVVGAAPAPPRPAPRSHSTLPHHVRAALPDPLGVVTHLFEIAGSLPPVACDPCFGLLLGS